MKIKMERGQEIKEVVLLNNLPGEDAGDFDKRQTRLEYVVNYEDRTGRLIVTICEASVIQGA